MEAMFNTVKGWQENPAKFARSHGVSLSPEVEESDPETGLHILIVEGFPSVSRTSSASIIKQNRMSRIRTQKWNPILKLLLAH